MDQASHAERTAFIKRIDETWHHYIHLGLNVDSTQALPAGETEPSIRETARKAPPPKQEEDESDTAKDWVNLDPSKCAYAVIEWCCSPTSNLCCDNFANSSDGKPVARIRLTARHDVSQNHKGVRHCHKVLDKFLGKCPVILWVSLPCTAGCGYVAENRKLYPGFAERSKIDQNNMRRMLDLLCPVAVRIRRAGGKMAFEWPERNEMWEFAELKRIVKACGLFPAHFNGCKVGLICAETGKPHLKPWKVLTNHNKLRKALNTKRCNHPKLAPDGTLYHETIRGKYTNRSGFIL